MSTLLREDVPMTPSPDRQEPERETMTIPRLATRVGRSRTLLHRLAANPDEGWPEPTYRPGSTRPEYDVEWFDGYWATRQAGIKQGKRTDLEEDETAPTGRKRVSKDEAHALFREIRGQSGDHLLNLFDRIEDVIEEKRPDLASLPLAGRRDLIGQLYMEAQKTRAGG
jgi:hypothetical protein